MSKKIWREDVQKEELNKYSINSACFGLLFILLIPLIISKPKLAVIGCIVLAFVSILLSVVSGIRAKETKPPVEDKQFYVLLNFYFSHFFCDSLEKAIGDDEVSVVTIFRGMDYFFELVKEHNIDFPYTTIREYITHTYSGGEEIYNMLLKRYDAEIMDYQSKEKSFEDMFGSINFNI